jgi:hypothetical protein
MPAGGWARRQNIGNESMPTEALDDADRPQSPRSTAVYIGRMSGELARLARRHRLEPLAYLLDMARLEADQIAKGSADANEFA